MRGLLVVNPKATTTSSRVADVIVHALSDAVDLDVTVTTHRGHAIRLGEVARAERLDVVLTLGGDGVVNEVVNGLLADGPGDDVPALATVPGGSANVFARSLGIPADPVEATGHILDALRERRTRVLGLGRADERWFVANAGLGIDAEIIGAMEAHRAKGRAATPARYVTTSITTFFRGVDRREAPLTVSRAGGVGVGGVGVGGVGGGGVDGDRDESTVSGVSVAFIQNTSPWTYLGSRPVNPCPLASFDTGLDLFALRGLQVTHALRAVSRMLRNSGPGRERSSDSLVQWHDVADLTIRADHPVAMQVDGEAAGLVDAVRFTAHRGALRVYA